MTSNKLHNGVATVVLVLIVVVGLAAFNTSSTAGVFPTVEGASNSISGDSTIRTVGVLPLFEDQIVHVATDSAGNIYATSGVQIYRIDPSGLVTLLAGTGEVGSLGDGGPALFATFESIRDIAISRDDILYVATNDRIRAIDPATGIVSAFAGTGEQGFAGDGGLAVDAQMRDPVGIGTASDGSVYIADTFNGRVRRVDPSGIITTVAGGGSRVINISERLPALSLKIARPLDVAADDLGRVYFIQAGVINHVVQIDVGGTATIFAGRHGPGSDGDGGLAADAAVGGPSSIVIDAWGSVFVSQRDTASVKDVNNRVRRIGTDGIITTVAGTGVRGNSGDGGPAAAAEVYFPGNITVDALGSLYFATDQKTLRKISANEQPLANAGENAEILLGEEVVLNGLRSSDPDDDTLFYLWTIGSRPEGSLVELSDATSVQSTFTPDMPGEYRVFLVVHDGRLMSAPDGLLITVRSVQGSLVDLESSVEELIISGQIDEKQASGLIATLGVVADAVERGKTNTAEKQMQAFVRQIDAMMRRGTLDAEEGAALIDSANAIIASFSE